MSQLHMNGVSYSIDDFLKAKLDNVKLLQDKDFDCVFLIDGGEGSGKSTLALLCSFYLSNGKITAEHIAEGAEDAISKLKFLPDKSIIIIDEGSLLLSSKDVMTKEQKKLVKILNVIRQKNMILIVVSPSFFNLNKYIASDRSRFLLHVYTKGFDRGMFSYFGTKKKSYLYTLGKKNNNSYAKPKAQFNGCFVDFKPPFYKEYLQTKRNTLSVAFDGDSAEGKRMLHYRDQRDKLLWFLRNEKKFQVTELANILGVSVKSASEYLSDHRERLGIAKK